MASNLKKQWRVEWRLSRDHKWRKSGLFETRDTAREVAFIKRECVTYSKGMPVQPVGFGNTRVVPYVKACK